jgi:hypothetical protein
VNSVRKMNSRLGVKCNYLLVVGKDNCFP